MTEITPAVAGAVAGDRGTAARQGTDAYARSGVDIDAGEELVARLRPLAAATARPGVLADFGGFAAGFDPRAAGFADPVLLAATDGVGTKLAVAIAADRLDTVGVDLVAMCVNDLVVQGATPLFFLDYFATGRLDVDRATAVMRGIAAGCRVAGCALIGGETAEMPGFYADGDFDLAGFAVGAVERGRLLDGRSVTAGDAVIGIASSGVHANGFSLVRRLVAEQGLDWAAPAPFPVADQPTATLADALLTPTRIYVPAALAAIGTGAVKALAHITGGGLLDNIPRTLPDGLGVVLDAAAWPVPPVFGWLAQAGALPSIDLARTFNLGIGMTAIVAAERVADFVAAFAAAGETAMPIGTVTTPALHTDEPAREGTLHGPRVTIRNADRLRKVHPLQGGER